MDLSINHILLTERHPWTLIKALRTINGLTRGTIVRPIAVSNTGRIAVSKLDAGGELHTGPTGHWFNMADFSWHTDREGNPILWYGAPDQFLHNADGTAVTTMTANTGPTPAKASSEI